MGKVGVVRGVDPVAQWQRQAELGESFRLSREARLQAPSRDGWLRTFGRRAAVPGAITAALLCSTIPAVALTGPLAPVVAVLSPVAAGINLRASDHEPLTGADGQRTPTSAQDEVLVMQIQLAEREGTMVDVSLAAAQAANAIASRSEAGVAGPAEVAGTTGIPVTVLAAYRRAELYIASSDPSCHLPWWVLAGIGRIESGHASGGRVDANGTTRGKILGIRLDGSTPGTAVIRDSDGGALDGDPVYDRAVGPMQFLPGTWRTWGRDGNGDGVVDPHNVFDAATAAGAYLCAGGRDLSVGASLAAAILSYNYSSSYLSSVLTWGMAYRDGATPSIDRAGTVPVGVSPRQAQTPAAVEIVPVDTTMQVLGPIVPAGTTTSRAWTTTASTVPAVASPMPPPSSPQMPPSSPATIPPLSTTANPATTTTTSTTTTTTTSTTTTATIPPTTTTATIPPTTTTATIPPTTTTATIPPTTTTATTAAAPTTTAASPTCDPTPTAPTAPTSSTTATSIISPTTASCPTPGLAGAAAVEPTTTGPLAARTTPPTP
ncbi:lytic transglycosylase domain-containing protein [Lapillicoccus sp.]|uniref:lytic transglycosylase domain-containing protein n=1 Tax=Lapillicoccus sp. TaxID=1909287 RepID=UPI0039836C05